MKSRPDWSLSSDGLALIGSSSDINFPDASARRPVWGNCGASWSSARPPHFPRMRRRGRIITATTPPSSTELHHLFPLVHPRPRRCCRSLRSLPTSHPKSLILRRRTSSFTIVCITINHTILLTVATTSQLTSRFTSCQNLTIQYDTIWRRFCKGLYIILESAGAARLDYGFNPRELSQGGKGSDQGS